MLDYEFSQKSSFDLNTSTSGGPSVSVSFWELQKSSCFWRTDPWSSSNTHYIKCIWASLFRVPSQGNHDFPYDSQGLPESFAHFLANDLQNILDLNWAVYIENSDSSLSARVGRSVGIHTRLGKTWLLIAVSLDSSRKSRSQEHIHCFGWFPCLHCPQSVNDHPDDAARFNNANAVLEFLKTSGGLISAEKLEEVAEDSLIALVDGELSDATGVANAVYQGRVSIKGRRVPFEKTGQVCPKRLPHDEILAVKKVARFGRLMFSFRF